MMFSLKMSLPLHYITFIITFISHHQYNSFHQQFNPSSTHHAYLIQHIINSIFTFCSFHHQFTIHILLTNHELSHSSSKHHETFHAISSHNQTPISTYECELRENNKTYQFHLSHLRFTYTSRSI